MDLNFRVFLSSKFHPPLPLNSENQEGSAEEPCEGDDLDEDDQFCEFPQGTCTDCKPSEFANKTTVRQLFGNEVQECCFGGDHSAYIFEEHCKVHIHLRTYYFAYK